MTVDSVHNLIIVANRVDLGGRESSDGILIFNRTDNGDVAPRAVIAGPTDRHHQDPPGGRRRGARPDLRDHQEQLRELRVRGRASVAVEPGQDRASSACGASTTTATCRRAASSRDPATGLIWPAGVAINPKNHEVYTIDSVSNALFMFHMPELFRKPQAALRGLNR